MENCLNVTGDMEYPEKTPTLPGPQAFPTQLINLGWINWDLNPGSLAYKLSTSELSHHGGLINMTDV